MQAVIIFKTCIESNIFNFLQVFYFISKIWVYLQPWVRVRIKKFKNWKKKAKHYPQSKKLLWWIWLHDILASYLETRYAELRISIPQSSVSLVDCLFCSFTTRSRGKKSLCDSDSFKKSFNLRAAFIALRLIFLHCSLDCLHVYVLLPLSRWKNEVYCKTTLQREKWEEFMKIWMWSHTFGAYNLKSCVLRPYVDLAVPRACFELSIDSWSFCCKG